MQTNTVIHPAHYRVSILRGDGTAVACLVIAKTEAEAEARALQWVIDTDHAGGFEPPDHDYRVGKTEYRDQSRDMYLVA